MSKTKEPLKVVQEKLPGSQVGLEVEIPAERSRQAYEQIVTHFMRSADIPGFRRGKVPRQVVVQRFGSAHLRAAALEELVEKSFNEAVEQENVPALGNFQLRSKFEELLEQFQPGEAFKFSASVDVPPEVVLKKRSGFEVSAEEVKYDPEQVEKILAEQQSSRATLVPVEGRMAQEGDMVLIDFSGTYFLDESETESAEIEGGSATDFQLELTPGQFIPGFTESIVGMAIDEVKELKIKFPDEYFQEDLAGKTALFEITLREIKQKELPELDDAFAQEVSEFETLAELREFLEERYKNEAQAKTDANVEAALLDALVAEMEGDVPETLITNEVNFLINQTASRLQGQGMDISKLFTKETIPALRDRFRDEAVVRVQRTMALAEVAEQESIEVTTEDLEKRFQEVIASAGDRDLDRDRLKDVLEEELLQEQVIAWLKEQSVVTLTEPKPEEELDSSTESAANTETETSEPKASKKSAKTKTSEKKKPAAKSEVEPEAETDTAAKPKKTTRRKTTAKAKSTESPEAED